MDDVLDEAYGIVQCKQCPWYKACVVPMRSSPDMGLQSLLSGMATAAQNSLLEGCPVFIERLRSSPRLAQRLKEMMQNWAMEEE
jgi:hypothetical protein